MKKIIFSIRPVFNDLSLLLLRVGVTVMMMTHGWGKIVNFKEMLGQFSDPLGLGAATSLQLAIFAEFFCAILVALGFFTRFALIPMIITMLTVVFIAHGGDPFAAKEMALLYLLVFIFLMLRGPGKFSLDGQVLKRNKKYKGY